MQGLTFKYKDARCLAGTYLHPLPNNVIEKLGRYEDAEEAGKIDKAIHYRKITENDVFTVIIHVALDPFQHTEGVISAPNIADFLGTSVYQVRKHISELVKKNLVKRAAG